MVDCSPSDKFLCNEMYLLAASAFTKFEKHKFSYRRQDRRTLNARYRRIMDRSKERFNVEIMRSKKNSTFNYMLSALLYFFAKWTHKVNLIDNRKYADKGQIMYVGLAFWHLSKKCFVIFWWFWKPLMGNTWPRTLPHETSWPQYHASFSFLKTNV